MQDRTQKRRHLEVGLGGGDLLLLGGDLGIQVGGRHLLQLLDLLPAMASTSVSVSPRASRCLRNRKAVCVQP